MPWIPGLSDNIEAVLPDTIPGHEYGTMNSPVGRLASLRPMILFAPLAKMEGKGWETAGHSTSRAIAVFTLRYARRG